MLKYDEQESRKKITQDYYILYHEVNNSYKIFRLAGRKNDAYLNGSILEPRRLNNAKSIKNLILAVVLTAGIFSIAGLPLVGYCQLSTSTPSSSSPQNVGTSDSMKKQTSDGALDVMLQPSPSPIVHASQTSLKVQFMTKGTGTVQPHIDYDVTVKDNSGKQLFAASQLAGQPGKPLHTAEGVVTIPYKFQASGDYIINVTVFGILFNPIRPESANFTIKVT